MLNKIILVTSIFCSLSWGGVTLAATLSLTPSSQTIGAGQSFKVDIILNTQSSPADSVDINTLSYDPNLLEVIDQNTSLAGVQITPGSLLSNTVFNNTNSATGTIIFSQINSGGLTYNGQGTLASITFKALRPGTAKVSYDFIPSNSIDCNVGSRGNEVLTSVTNAFYTVTQTSFSPTPTPTTTPTPTVSPGPTALPLPPGTRPRPSQYGLKEGMTVAAYGSNDPDIYIINDAGFKRLFLNPVIFSFYGHLGGFKYVTSISSAVRDAFETTGIFRNCETNDPKVYAVQVTGEDTGTLHHLNLSGDAAVAQDAEFFKKVFCINNNEFNWYTNNGKVLGAAYTAINQIPKYKRN